MPVTRPPSGVVCRITERGNGEFSWMDWSVFARGGLLMAKR